MYASDIHQLATSRTTTGGSENAAFLLFNLSGRGRDLFAVRRFGLDLWAYYQLLTTSGGTESQVYVPTAEAAG